MFLRHASIRVKLTAWYVAVLVAILCVLSLGVFFFVENRLESLARAKLDSGYATVEAVVRNSGGDIFDVAHFGHSNLFTLLSEGRAVYESNAWKEAALDQAGYDGAESGYSIWESPDQRHFRIRKGSIPRYGFDLVFAHDASASVETVESLGLILTASVPAALVLALLGGWFLARTALSPVKKITRKAREITADHLAQRLPVPGSNDEISALATVFNETLARLERSFEQLRRFTADASHELRTPLSSLRSVGEVALHDPKDADAYRGAISSMLEEADRLTHLIENLLVLARSDSGRAKPALVRFDLDVLIREVTEELHVLAEEKSQQIEVASPGTMEIEANRASLRQAFANVLHNAIRYSPEGGRIHVELTCNRLQATVTVVDEGPGIDPDEHESVFERFYRVDGARGSASGGVGLGLSIARAAIRDHGGTIGFDDGEWNGACCRMTLPLHGEIERT